MRGLGRHGRGRQGSRRAPQRALRCPSLRGAVGWGVAAVVIAGLVLVGLGGPEPGPVPENELTTGLQGGVKPTGGVATSPAPEPAEPSAGSPSGPPAKRRVSSSGQGGKRVGSEVVRGVDSDVAAIAYFRARWADRPANRIKDIRSVGGYLRIYTDLPESAGNSSDAITLCERGRRYLVEEVGVDRPVLFVQARSGENGNPVVANLIGGSDRSCRVTHPAPRA
ncbi:hypothetical protein [Rhizohabitans arisaemae]|uniref:hypothetical protein n=1 Tax=Rhizohabitans arisaemae TaxID=2720610 RepID=UPI0024B05ABB|nr:hypothetical protein [Rhizohabitans arisaemae]